VGTLPLNIGGVHFSDGIGFTAPGSFVLEAGAFALVVRDQAAFEALYGPGLPVIGQFDPDALNNEGERIELRDASGNVIHEFTFSDAWYPATDGGGYSLVARDEKANLANWNTAAGWKISGAPGGNPNADNLVSSARWEEWQRDHFTQEQLSAPAISGPLGDANADGTANLIHYAAGLHPWSRIPPEFLPGVGLADGRFRLSVRTRKNAVDLQVAADFGSDLTSWEEVLLPVSAPIDHGDGTATLVFEDPVPAGAQRFARVRVTLTPP